MRILSANHYPAIPRTVIRVVENPDDPHWVHENKDSDGEGLGTFSPCPRGHTGNTDEPGDLCHDCRNNWRMIGPNGAPEFTWDRGELYIGLNKWGNPIHDAQEIVSTRLRTWDEMYGEIEERLGEVLEYGDAPRQGAPSLVLEVELDFELEDQGEPHLGVILESGGVCCGGEEGEAHQRYRVLRHGVRAGAVVAYGATAEEFQADRDAKYEAEKERIVAAEESRDVAKAIVGA